IRRRHIAALERELRLHPARFASGRDLDDYRIAHARSILRDHWLTCLRLSLRPFVLLPDAPTFLEVLGQTGTGRGTSDILTRFGCIAAAQHYFDGRTGLIVPLLPLLLIVLVTYVGCILQLVHWV